MSIALFLDFDGVLHPSIAVEGIVLPPTETSCAERNLFCWVPHLEDVIASMDESARNDLLIAAHSSWRRVAGLSQDLVRQQLGPVLGPLYVGMTRPELARWPSIQDMARRMGTDDFIILDDARDEFSPGLAQLIVCNPLRGMSDPQVQDALREHLHVPAAKIPIPRTTVPR